MKIKIAPQKVEKKNFIFNPKVKFRACYHEILRVELNDEYTRIDFLYKNRYPIGGWFQIRRDTFIRISGGKVKYGLIKAVNIPIAPRKHFFKRMGDVIYYTLYFPALPKKVTKIDIIEKEEESGTWFNFYKVSMRAVKRRYILVAN